MAPWSGGFRFELFNAPSDFATLPGNSVTIHSGADLSGTTFIRGISTTDTLTPDNVALRGGSFDIVDPTLGADQGSFKTINLSNGAVLSLTNNLRTNTGPARDLRPPARIAVHGSDTPPRGGRFGVHLGSRTTFPNRLRDHEAVIMAIWRLHRHKPSARRPAVRV